METKTCKKCGRELPLQNFKHNYLSADGYTNICRDCSANKYRKTVKSRHEEKSFALPINGGNPELKSFTPRELIEELKARGYKGKLQIVREINL